MDSIIIMILILVTISTTLSLIILFFMRKEIQDIQQSANYIYNNQDKVDYIYKVVKEVRKERRDKAT